MKAMVYTSYGQPGVLHFSEVEKPAPTDNEVLIKIYAVSVNYSDWAMVRGKPFMLRLMVGGLFRPKNAILGKDIAGRVEAVGKNITQFQPGDEVYGDLSDCGFGALAEYVSVPEYAVALKPASLSFEEAAAVPEAALVALHGLREEGKIQPGQKVLIHGASGGIGTFAVQLAKCFGAEVTAVCSTRNVELVRSLGADHVIDYTKEDFASNRQQFDLILATAGYRSIFEYERALKPGGILVATGGALAQIFQPMVLGPWISKVSHKTLTTLNNHPNQKDLALMATLLDSGKVKPIIDRRYPLSEVAEAIQYYGEGKSRGKVIINIVE
jgi:NADPH:quinone reductase-like Zn-dependent oxidoreductase